MALTYADVGAYVFGEREFTGGEFSRLTGSPRAAKALSELTIRGVVSRVGRGRYRFLRPSEKPDLRAAVWNRAREVLLDGPEPKAWDGPSAVEVWTRGRYRVSPSLYSRVFYLVVPSENLSLWKRYVVGHGISLRGRKRIGARVEVRGTSAFRRVVVGGESVVPRNDVVEMIHSHPGLYANAERLLIDG